MNGLNTRQWSTPATIGAGIFVSVSGVMMFLGVHNPLELAYEWIGLVFVTAFLLHILTHWRAFRKYFSQGLALGVVGAVAVVSSALIISSATQEGGDAIRNIIRGFEGSPLTEVAPLLDQGAESIVTRFEMIDFAVKGVGSSIEEIAADNGTAPKTLVRVLIRMTRAVKKAASSPQQAFGS